VKILLISCPVMDYVNGRLKPIAMDAGRECAPYGIYLLSSILKQAGNEVILADLVASGSHDIQPYIAGIEDCSLIGISATTLSWPIAVMIIEQIRQASADVPIVLGGIHPSMFDKYILKTYPVQYIIRGEGELALPALCKALERGGTLGNIPNLTWTRKDDEIVRNPAGPLISGEEIASFPLPDYDILPSGVYKCLSIESSRGCAFDCAFCSTSYRQSWRAIPADKFVDRLEAILPYLDRTVGKIVQIVDDEFSTNPQRAIEIARTIRERGIKLNMVYNARATDLLAEGFLENMAEFTVQFLVGAESGYDEGLKRVGKGTTCQIMEDAAKKLEEHGMAEKADFSFILGLPWETIEEVKKTISFAMNLMSQHGIHAILQWYTQIPGSRLWDEERRTQKLHESMYDELGFFRNIYLTRGGIRLSPQEIWEIWEILSQMRWLAGHLFPRRKVVKFGIPPPIVRYFPLDSLDTDGGLANLRELSRPQIKV
jgi:radical SAM superfamily enzyme YgiQ (UPF0313 family)